MEPLNRSYDMEQWIDAILRVAGHYRLAVSPENLRVSGRWEQEESLDIALGLVAKQAGLSISFSTFDRGQLNAWRLPMVVGLNNGDVAVIESVDAEQQLGLVFSKDSGQQTQISFDELVNEVATVAVFRPARRVADVRIDDYIKPYEKNWLWKIIRRDRRHYSYVMLASLVANTLALAGVIFSMQVYDRVVPAESMPTLYVLFIGVLVAVGFDFMMRITRIRIIDLLGKRADIRISDRVFGHALRLQNSARPKSTRNLCFST